MDITENSTSGTQAAKSAVNRSGHRHIAPKYKKLYWGVGWPLLAFVGAWFATLLISTVVTVVVLANNPSIYDGVPLNDAAALTEATMKKAGPLLILAGMLPLWLVWLSSGLLISRLFSGVGSKFKSTLAAFKANIRWGFKKKDILIGFGTAFTFILFQLVVLNFIVPTLFPSFKNEDVSGTTQQTLMFLPGAWKFIIPIVCVAILGPIVEEIFFRGFILQGFRNSFMGKPDIYTGELGEPTAVRSWLRTHRNTLAITLSSVLFGLQHLQSFNVNGLTTVVIPGLLGAVMAYLTVKTNRLGPAIFTHIFHNSFAVVIMFLGS